MNLANPFVRMLVYIVVIAAALRLTWLLIEPVLPAIGVVLAVFAVWRLWCWYRDRW